MAEDFVTRKEFDEWKVSYEQRHTAIQLQLAESLGVAKTNQEQIRSLTDTAKELTDAMQTTERQIAISAVYNKILWPTVTTMATVIAYLIGTTKPF